MPTSINKKVAITPTLTDVHNSNRFRAFGTGNSFRIEIFQ